MFNFIKAAYLMAKLLIAIGFLFISALATTLIALSLVMPMIGYVMHLPVKLVRARQKANLKVVIDDAMDDIDNISEAA